MTPKFRVWDKYEDELVSDIYFNWQDCGYESLNEVFSDDRWIFMRSTGLKDKNGKEIFEGDVIKYPCSWEVHGTDEPEFAFVEFKNTLPYANHGRADLTLDDLLLDGSDWEVIGNIYENPELVEG